jgi:hypothetical protein
MLPIAPNLLQTDLLPAVKFRVRIKKVCGARSDEVYGIPVYSRRFAGPASGEDARNFLEHLRSRHTHQIDRLELFVFAVQEPDRWAVRLPPKSVRDRLVGLCNVHLHRNDATLVVDAHQHTQSDVEENPAAYPQLYMRRSREWDRGEYERDGRDEESSFLMRE